MKTLSVSTKENIISLLSSGLSAIQVAKYTCHSKSSISKIRSQYLPDLQKSIGGRPAKLTPTMKRHAKYLIISRKSDTAAGVAKSLQNNLNHSVSAETVRRALKNEGLKAVTKKKRPFLSVKHRRERMDFAISHRDWTIEDWKKVI